MPFEIAHRIPEAVYSASSIRITLETGYVNNGAFVVVGSKEHLIGPEDTVTLLSGTPSELMPRGQAMQIAMAELLATQGVIVGEIVQ